MNPLEAFLKKYFSDQGDTFLFQSESDKDTVIKELSSRFTVSGDTVVNVQNGQVVDFGIFEGVVFSVSNPYLKVRGSGKYVPLFTDNRTAEVRAKHKEDVEKLVDHFFDRKGYAFRYEHLNDSTIRQSIRNTIAANFLYGGVGDDGQVVFRKFSQGMFSKDFDPNEVIESYAKPFLDRNRTEAKQAELKANNSLEEKPVVYSRKVLPKRDVSNYTKEFERRGLFKFGLPNKQAATLQTRRMVESYRDEQLKKLDTFDVAQDLKDLAKYETPRESWGIETENKTGFYLPPDML